MTLTWAAVLLRQHGSRSVYPFALRESITARRVNEFTMDVRQYLSDDGASAAGAVFAVA